MTTSQPPVPAPTPVPAKHKVPWFACVAAPGALLSNADIAFRSRPQTSDPLQGNETGPYWQPTQRGAYGPVGRTSAPFAAAGELLNWFAAVGQCLAMREQSPSSQAVA